jgi:hypothetical protein
MHHYYCIAIIIVTYHGIANRSDDRFDCFFFAYVGARIPNATVSLASRGWCDDHRLCSSHNSENYTACHANRQRQVRRSRCLRRCIWQQNTTVADLRTEVVFDHHVPPVFVVKQSRNVGIQSNAVKGIAGSIERRGWYI